MQRMATDGQEGWNIHYFSKSFSKVSLFLNSYACDAVCFYQKFMLREETKYTRFININFKKTILFICFTKHDF